MRPVDGRPVGGTLYSLALGVLTRGRARECISTNDAGRRAAGDLKAANVLVSRPAPQQCTLHTRCHGAVARTPSLPQTSSAMSTQHPTASLRRSCCPCWPEALLHRASEATGQAVRLVA